MRFLSVIRWMLLIVVTIVGIVCAGGGVLWLKKDRWLQQKLVQTFEARAPQLTLHVDEIRLPGTATLQLGGVEIRDRASGRPLVRISEIQAEIDDAQLLERQTVLLRSLRLSGVDLLLKRTAEGRWNWQEYSFPQPADQVFVPPQIRVQDLRMQLILEHAGSIPPAELLLAVPDFQAIPASGQGYDVTGQVVLPGAGTLALDGDLDLKSRSWKLAGRVRDVAADQNLLTIAQSTMPQLSEKIDTLERALAQALQPATEGRLSARPDAAALPGVSGALSVGEGDTSVRFVGLIDVDFEAMRAPAADIPELQLKVAVREGSLACPVLPWRFAGIAASMSVSNTLCSIELQSARDGNALVSGRCLLPLGTAETIPEASLHLENFPVTMQMKSLVPLKSQRFFDHFQPGGSITGDAVLKRMPSGRWVPVSVEAVTQDGVMRFHRFRQQVTSVRAQLSQRPLPTPDATMQDVVFDIRAEGTAGGNLVTAAGWIRNPGPELELRFDVHAEHLPLDTAFRDALDEPARKVIEALNLTGEATADVACYREPGLDRPTDIRLTGNVRNSKLRFRSFPYDVENLSGLVKFQSKEKRWTFENLAGRHGEAQLSGQGTFMGLPTPGTLNLTVQSQNAKLDADLFNALPPASRTVWSIINPEGRVDLTTLISWTAAPGSKPSVSLQNVHVYEARICPQPFPYPMAISSAKLSFVPDAPEFSGRQHCEIHSLNAQHEGSQISASGWAEVSPDGEWQLHLNDVNASRLRPDDELRAALPDSWRQFLSRLGQAGQISIESSEIDFRGMVDQSAAPTAAWRVNCLLEGCELNAGLGLTNVNGRVRAGGSWDGVDLNSEGDLQLSSLEVLEMRIGQVSGPWKVTNEELVLGHREVILGKAKPQEVELSDRIQGQAFGGRIEMDGLVNLRAGSSWRFFGELKNALLEQYARQQAPDQRNLRGVLNSWIFVSGDSDQTSSLKGRGQVQISPASLYETPVVLELLRALPQLNFAVNDRTAFNHALMTFEIADSAFWFDPIDLVGESISLRGRGRIGFEGDVVLDFFSRPNRGPGLRNPISDILTTSATQWVTVQVRGTINRPQTTVSNRPQINEQLRQFLAGFEPRPGAPAPALVIPNAFGLSFGQPPIRNRRQN
ncbi:MAG: hypothetical protein ACK55P_05695 [Planctomyces sp.]